MINSLKLKKSRPTVYCFMSIQLHLLNRWRCFYVQIAPFLSAASPLTSYLVNTFTNVSASWKQPPLTAGCHSIRVLWFVLSPAAEQMWSFCFFFSPHVVVLFKSLTQKYCFSSYTCKLHICTCSKYFSTLFPLVHLWMSTVSEWSPEHTWFWYLRNKNSPRKNTGFLSCLWFLA